MPAYSRTRIAAGTALTAVSVVAAALGNETVLPTAVIGALLAWQPDRRGSRDAARAAIATYSVFMGALSLLVSLFLPAVADAFDLNGVFDGDFVRVTTNDAHEFGYACCLLLALLTGFRLVFDRTAARTGGSAA